MAPGVLHSPRHGMVLRKSKSGRIEMWEERVQDRRGQERKATVS